MTQRLFQRGQTYYYRRRIPRQLRSIIGRSEIKISLRTPDRALAKQLLSVYKVIYNHSFSQLHNRLTMFDLDDLKKRALDLTIKKTTHSPNGQRVERVFEATVYEIARLKEADIFDGLVRAALDGNDNSQIESKTPPKTTPTTQPTIAINMTTLGELTENFNASRLSVRKEAGEYLPVI